MENSMTVDGLRDRVRSLEKERANLLQLMQVATEETRRERARREQAESMISELRTTMSVCLSERGYTEHLELLTFDQPPSADTAMTQICNDLLQSLTAVTAAARPTSATADTLHTATHAPHTATHAPHTATHAPHTATHAPHTGGHSVCTGTQAPYVGSNRNEFGDTSINQQGAVGAQQRRPPAQLKLQLNERFVSKVETPAVAATTISMHERKPIIRANDNYVVENRREGDHYQSSDTNSVPASSGIVNGHRQNMHRSLSGPLKHPASMSTVGAHNDNHNDRSSPSMGCTGTESSAPGPGGRAEGDYVMRSLQLNQQLSAVLEDPLFSEGSGSSGASRVGTGTQLNHDVNPDVGLDLRGSGPQLDDRPRDAADGSRRSPKGGDESSRSGSSTDSSSSGSSPAPEERARPKLTFIPDLRLVNVGVGSWMAGETTSGEVYHA